MAHQTSIIYSCDEDNTQKILFQYSSHIWSLKPIVLNDEQCSS